MSDHEHTEEDERMTDPEEWLVTALEDHFYEHDMEASIRSFREAGVLTENQGWVVRIGDSEFHVTVMQAR